MVLPCASVMVIMVLLNDAFTCATPEAMFLRSRRRTRAASLPIHDPFAAGADQSSPAGCLTWYLRRRGRLLLAGNGFGRPLAGPGVCMGALATNRKALAVPHPTVAAQIHEPLDVHGHFTP